MKKLVTFMLVWWISLLLSKILTSENGLIGTSVAMAIMYWYGLLEPIMFKKDQKNETR